MFRQIKGQDQVVSLLSTQIANDRVAQAYLFHGQDGIGKLLTALYFGMGLNCLSSNQFKPCGVCNSCRKFLAYEHPDFIYVFPSANLQMTSEGEIKNNESRKQYLEYIENKINSPWQDLHYSGAIEIRKESITMLSKRLELSISEAKYRIVIIEDADMMNPSTANAFLKKLEEPPPSTVLILLTERLSMMLPTLISRCQQVYFKPLANHVIESLLKERFDIDAGLAKTAARIANGSFKEAARLALDSNSEIRKLSFELLQQAYEANDMAFYTFLSKLKDTFNAEKAKELIRFMTALVNDLVIVQTDPEQVTNIDQLEFLSDISLQRYAIRDRALDYLLILQDLNRKISRNVNLSLILIKLYNSLKNCLAA
ncbi:MAG: DNA polymerase III subunit delta' [Candidatus Cloacimonadota bacterium]